MLVELRRTAGPYRSLRVKLTVIHRAIQSTAKDYFMEMHCRHEPVDRGSREF